MMKKTMMLTGICVLGLAVSASADIKQIKIYKEAYPDSSPKCIQCHTDKLPKKDAGKHDLNEYGKKAVAENATPTAETYTKVGPVEPVQE